MEIGSLKPGLNTLSAAMVKEDHGAVMGAARRIAELTTLADDVSETLELNLDRLFGAMPKAGGAEKASEPYGELAMLHNCIDRMYGAIQRLQEQAARTRSL